LIIQELLQLRSVIFEKQIESWISSSLR